MTPPDEAPQFLSVAGPAPSLATSDPLWYKDAVIYQLHVKAFFDANDDGIGDFQGLYRKLDYLQNLGVTTLWLLPFYPSPLRDDGYDIADYKNINPSYGRMADFRTFVREAHRRNMRVITELVINHTSDQHPWFQRARQSKSCSPWRDFYVWSDTDQKFLGTRIIFVDSEKSNWAWDPVAQAYYWHRFYAHQPDLNFDNPRVFRAISEIMRFWLDLGVDGLRLDAVPYLIEREGTINENLPETHEVLRRLRRELDQRYRDRMLLAEANQWPEDVLPYFGVGDECHMAFHFPLMPRIYMAVSTEDRYPITDIMRQTPDIPESCQWAIFLRNHDELTLEMVTDRERDYLWNYYAADRRARINLGIRRRLAPLMENDRRRIELLNALLMSMPGTPVIYYGDEIGMGDSVFLRDRDGVRTPMQWTPDRNGGFSRADPERLYLPPIMDAVYGFEAVNVEAQSRSPSSLLNWMKRMIAARHARRAFGRGSLHFLYPSNRKVIAYLRCYEDETILCVANLSRSPQAVELDLADYRGYQPIELLGRSVFPTIGDLPYLLTLQPHSFFWFDLLLSPQQAANLQAPPPEFVTLVMPQGWSDLFRQHNLQQLENEVIPAFLLRQGWYDSKLPRIAGATLRAHGEIRRSAPSGAESYLVNVVETRLRDGSSRNYLLPFASLWAPSGTDLRQGLILATLAELRQFRREGAMVDAFSQDGFLLALMDLIASGASVPLEYGELRCIQAKAFDASAMPEAPTVRRGKGEQSNSSVFFDDYAMLRLYRRLEPGPHPEIELSRFLVERANFANTPPPLAVIEARLDGGGSESLALGVLFGFIRNQGNGWNQALNYLTRYLDDALIVTHDEASERLPDPDLFFLALARQIGIRTGQMHRALAEHAGDDPDFMPEPITGDDIAGWRAALAADATELLARLEHERGQLSQRALDRADSLLAAREPFLRAILTLLPDEIDAQKTRAHGDYHLGRVIVVQNDFFVDVASDPTRSLTERRAKTSPLRDVAGMIRSFDYAASAAVRLLAETRAAAEPRMAELAESWRQHAVDGFRAAYRKAMRGCVSYPANKKQARDLTRFFMLEGWVYAARRELAERPLWFDIPLQGILDIVNRKG
jgi:maltose alpha-D-glucosyltransferase / alpha-amylase